MVKYYCAIKWVNWYYTSHDCCCFVSKLRLTLLWPRGLYAARSLSMGFLRQGCWCRLHFIFQGIFPTQGLNHLLRWQVHSLPLSHQGSPHIIINVFQKHGRPPGGGNGNPVQYSCLVNPMHREPGGYSPQGEKQADMTKHVAHVTQWQRSCFLCGDPVSKKVQT